MKIFYLTRDEIYARLWSKPIRDNAKDLGLSDVGLAKLCRRSGIPLPPQGYWLMTPGPQRDRLVQPLPLEGPGDQHAFRFRVEELEVVQRIEAARAAAIGGIAVMLPSEADLTHAARLTKLMRKAIDTRKRDERGILNPQGKAPGPLRVSAAQLDRALLALERLVARLSALKVPIEQHLDHAGLLTAELNGQKYSFGVEENATRSERPLTAREQKEKAQRDKDGHYFYHRDRWQYTPSGKLTLKLGHDRFHYARKQWGDTVGARIEERIEFVIADSFALAEDGRAEQERRRKAQRRAEARRLWELRRVRREQYAAQKIRELKRQARDWGRAEVLRAYVDAVVCADLSTTPAFRDVSQRSAWAAWACQVIDALNPIANRRAGTMPKRPRRSTEVD